LLNWASSSQIPDPVDFGDQVCHTHAPPQVFDSSQFIQRNKRRLGRNSQAGLEASNLVGQLQEEFVNTTKGFKDVLQVRSDRIKERTDKESHLLGGVGSGNDAGDFQQERISLLGNKPRVYEQSISGVGKSGAGTDIGLQNNFGSGLNSSGLNAFGAGAGGGLSDGPRLDLTSAIMQGSNQMQPGESTMQLPRPCEYILVRPCRRCVKFCIGFAKSFSFSLLTFCIHST
jgi:hypothetical protein